MVIDLQATPQVRKAETSFSRHAIVTDGANVFSIAGVTCAQAAANTYTRVTMHYDASTPNVPPTLFTGNLRVPSERTSSS